MRMYDIILKKRRGLELTTEEINFFVDGFNKDEIPDYQVSSLMMAIFFKGMNKRETADLTMAMVNSGDVLDLGRIEGIKVDKHSTGGVGDSVTLVLAPLVASLGIPVAKMSGRGLGHTGGTIDKLETFKGFSVELDNDTFINNVNNIKIAIAGQTKSLAPADKKLYALRDVTATVDNIPLIASSIMSKKIAAGANKIVLDVTCGSGAFMKNEEEARKLSNTMNQIGHLASKETVCVMTNMEEPLGYAVGNNLEVIEAIRCLKGDMPEDVKQVVLELGAYMIKLDGKNADIKENKQMILEQIENRKAYEKFVELVETQGGDISYLEDETKFKKADYIVPVIAKKEGYVKSVDAKRIGELSGKLGAGRVRKEDNVDQTVGIVLSKKVSDSVKIGEILGYIHANQEVKAKQAEKELEDIYEITKDNVKKPRVILDIIQ